MLDVGLLTSQWSMWLLTAVIAVVWDLHVGCGITYVAVVKVVTSCLSAVVSTVPALPVLWRRCVISSVMLSMKEVPYSIMLSLL